jgi:hypothetical protein
MFSLALNFGFDECYGFEDCVLGLIDELIWILWVDYYR